MSANLWLSVAAAARASGAPSTPPPAPPAVPYNAQVERIAYALNRYGPVTTTDLIAQMKQRDRRTVSPSSAIAALTKLQRAGRAKKLGGLWSATTPPTTDDA